MGGIPGFTSDGLLPQGDYEVSFAELRKSILVVGPREGGYPHWDRAWRAVLVDNLEVLVEQLCQAGIRDIFIDGSFAIGVQP